MTVNGVVTHGCMQCMAIRMYDYIWLLAIGSVIWNIWVAWVMWVIWLLTIGNWLGYMGFCLFASACFVPSSTIEFVKCVQIYDLFRES